MPNLVLAELECNSNVVLVPPLFFLSCFESFICEGDQSAVVDCPIEVELSVCGIKERLEDRVHFQCLR